MHAVCCPRRSGTSPFSPLHLLPPLQMHVKNTDECQRKLASVQVRLQHKATPSPGTGGRSGTRPPGCGGGREPVELSHGRQAGVSSPLRRWDVGSQLPAPSPTPHGEVPTGTFRSLWELSPGSRPRQGKSSRLEAACLVAAPSSWGSARGRGWRLVWGRKVTQLLAALGLGTPGAGGRPRLATRRRQPGPALLPPPPSPALPARRGCRMQSLPAEPNPS